MTNNELIDKIFKDPNVRYELSEFDNLNYDTVFEVITEYGTDCSGALIVHWKPEDIRNLKIPNFI